MGHDGTEGCCSTGHEKHGCAPQAKGALSWADDGSSGFILSLADKAWEHLMLEKMKAQWEKQRGQSMDKMAKAAVEASMAYWASSMEAEEKARKHREKIAQAWS